MIYFHSIGKVKSVLGSSNTDLPLFGAAGVDLFFVISGFVMWTSTVGRQISPFIFYRRRVARIVPLYWAVTLAASTIAIAAPEILRSTKFDIDHLLASLFFVPWPNPAVAPGVAFHLSPVVIPGWTLNYEMFFYVLFGAALLVSERKRPLVVASLILFSILGAHVFSQVLPTLHFYDSTMPLEFVGETFFAVLITNWKPPLCELPKIASIAALIALCVLEAYNPPPPRAIGLGSLSLLLVFSAVASEHSGNAPGAALLRHLGDASFSIYLIHGFIIAGLRIVVLVLGLRMTGLGGELLFVGTAMITSAAAGVALYHWFELPTSRAASRLLLPSSLSSRRRA